MKKITLLSLLCAMTIIGSAQVDATINPIGLLFGDFGVGADVGVSDNFSTELGVGFGGRSGDDGVGGDYKFSNLGINATAKYYFSPDDGADNFYSGIFLRYINRDYEYEETAGFSLSSDYTQTRFGVGFLAGYKAVGNSGIVFDINFGVGRALSDKTEFSDSDGVQTTIEWPELMVTGKLGIGYRFGG